MKLQVDSRYLSPIATLYLFWVIAFLGGISFAYRDNLTVMNHPLESNIINRILAAGLLCATLMPWLFRNLSATKKSIISLLSCLAGLRLISSLWSYSPTWTLYRSLEFIIIVTLLAYSITVIKSSQQLHRWISLGWSWQACLVLSAVFGAIFFPTQALVSAPNAFLPWMLYGVYPRINSNGLAQMAAILVIVSLHRILGEKPTLMRTCMLILGCGTLFLTQTRHIFGITLFVLILLLIYYRRLTLLWIIGILLSAILLIFSDNLLPVAADYLRRGQSDYTLLTLSCRTYWWKTIWEHLTCPVFFIGDGAFAGSRHWAAMLGASIGEPTRITLDNLWLELIIDNGIFAVLITLLLIIKMLHILWIFTHSQDKEIKSIASECFFVLVLLLCRSFFVSSLLLHSNFPFLFIVATAEYLRRRQTSFI